MLLWLGTREWAALKNVEGDNEPSQPIPSFFGL
jgi:hypothetical protein